MRYGALQGIGIGVPGPYAAAPGVLGVAPHESAAAGHPEPPAQAEFAERFGAPVIVDNNTRLAALAEAIFGSSSVEDLLYLRLSDGVGGGLVVGGRLVTGSSGLAGELGHVTVDPNGVECRCGKRGCVETLASVPAILASCRDLGLAVRDLDDLAVAVNRSHPIADQVLRTAGSAVGRVLGAASMVLDPADIVIGGEIARVAPVVLQQAAATIAFEHFPGARMPVVRGAQLSDDDGALGALAALFHNSPILAAYPEAADTTTHPAPIERAGTTRNRGAAHGRAH